MKYLVVLLFILNGSLTQAAQKAKIIGDYVEVYADGDFDSEVIDEVYKGQTYSVSDKNIGPFYKIKLKSGKIGYIVDYELDIEGKGPIKPQDLDELELLEERKLYNSKNPQAGLTKSDAEEEEAVFGRAIGGPFLQFINYHENTRGSTEVDDLAAIGYKSISVLAWSVMASFTTPKYYTQTVGASGKSVKIWADIGFSNTVAQFPTSEVRFSGNVFTHMSYIQLETPTDKYDLQDITMGINLEAAWQKKFQNFATDISIKYYFDKSHYAGLGLALLF